LVTVLTTNITQCGGFAQPGLLCTNITQTTLFTNIVVGDFYIIPANLCGFNILSTQLTSLSSSTNLIVLSTNAFGATNVGFQEFSESLITYFTQHVFIARGIVCTNDSPTLRQGMEKVTFFRRDYDSLLGQFYQPFTNTYRLYAITNNQLVLQTFQRVVTRPDFLFSAEERNAPDLAWRGIGFREVPRYVRFVPTPNPGAIDGPGILQPPITIEFNKVGPLFFNIGPFFVDEANAILNFIWGSFDGSTNTPVVYPNHRSIVDMENQVLMQMAPASLPDGSVGNSYTAQLSGNGGQPPYSWSRAPGSPGPPPGLTLLPTGTITGTPTDAGTFDFVVRMTDAGGRFIDRPYAITIQ
jgi:hypothetical protein